MFYVAKTNENARLASKKPEDAGLDLYPCFEENSIAIGPGEIKIIPTGIAVAFPNDHVFFIKERSSSGKAGLALRMGVVDSGYRGEIKIAISNFQQKTIEITKEVDEITETDQTILYPYSKGIAQGVFIKIHNQSCEEIDYEELLNIKSERGDNMFGSSGN